MAATWNHGMPDRQNSHNYPVEDAAWQRRPQNATKAQQRLAIPILQSTPFRSCGLIVECVSLKADWVRS